MEKQIEEMACAMCLVKHICNEPNKPIATCYALKCAERAYEENYRKQSEDAVEVVRCKDCKEWQRNVGFVNSPNGHCFCHDIDTNGHDFCSYGEMKGGAE